MKHSQNTAEGTSRLIQKASRRVRTYSSEIQRETWKSEHDDAMACFDFEQTLERGVGLFRAIVDLDEFVRGVLIEKEAPAKITAEIHSLLRQLVEWWVKPCPQVREALATFQSKGYDVKHSSEFLNCCADAEWILADDQDLFAHPSFAAARDVAIDELRQGDVG